MSSLSHAEQHELLLGMVSAPPQLDTDAIRDAVADGVAAGLERMTPVPASGATEYQQLVKGVTPATNTSYRYRADGLLGIIYPLSVMCRLTCSAAVGDRSVTLEYQDENDVRYCVAGVETLTLQANDVQSYEWYPNASTPSWFVHDVAVAPMPQQYVYPQASLVIKLTGGQAGDQLDQIRLSLVFYPPH